MQLAHFSQYILMLILGVAAYKYGWLKSIDVRTSSRWFIFAQGMIFTAFPLLFFLGGAANGNIEAFIGGLTLQSLSYCMWEQLTGFSLMIGLLGIFQNRFDSQNNLAATLSSSAFCVYAFHSPILVIIGLAGRSIPVPLVAKFLSFSLPVLVLCFGFAYLIKKTPLLKNIF